MNTEKKKQKNSDAAQNDRRDAKRERTRNAARKSPPSPLTEAIKISQELESILETKFGAQGRGLLEKATSVADSIPETTLGKIAEIATIRNEAAHNNGKIDQETLAKIRRLRDFVVDEFKKTPKRVNADPYERIANMSQKLEDLLEACYGADGRTLHEKLTSVEYKVTDDLRKKIRFVATIRNKATHEDVGLAAERLDDVLQNYASVLPELQELAAKRQANASRIFDENVLKVSEARRIPAQITPNRSATSGGFERSTSTIRRSPSNVKRSTAKKKPKSTAEIVIGIVMCGLCAAFVLGIAYAAFFH